MAGTSNSGGRNKKSTAMHLLRGTFRKERHGDHETPDPPKGKPEPPAALSPIARGEWDRMVARLEETGALSIVDDAAIYQYAQMFAETEQLRIDHLATRSLSEKLKKSIKSLDGRDLVDAIEQIVKLQFLMSKESQQLRQGHLAVRQFLIEFGMTPSARTRVKLPPKAKQSKVDKFMSSRNA